VLSKSAAAQETNKKKRRFSFKRTCGICPIFLATKFNLEESLKFQAILKENPLSFIMQTTAMNTVPAVLVGQVLRSFPMIPESIHVRCVQCKGESYLFSNKSFVW